MIRLATRVNSVSLQKALAQAINDAEHDARVGIPQRIKWNEQEGYGVRNLDESRRVLVSEVIPSLKNFLDVLKKYNALNVSLVENKDSAIQKKIKSDIGLALRQTLESLEDIDEVAARDCERKINEVANLLGIKL